jgi:uncharacterized protein YeaO (DUF488 family)
VELKSQPDQVAILKEESSRGPVTLIYAAKDEAHNEAAVLQAVLNRQTRRKTKRSAKTSQSRKSS